MTDTFYNSIVPAHVPSHLVHDFNLYDYGDADPFLTFHKMHQMKLPEMFWTRNNGGHWVILGSDAIADMGFDTRRFSNRRPYVPDSQNYDEPVFYPLLVDPPAHTRYRRAIAPLLLPNHISTLDSTIRHFTIELAHDFKRRGQCEFVADFANVMPVVTFMRFMDLPLTDREHLVKLGQEVVKPKESADSSDPTQGLFDYLAPIVDTRMAKPGDDIISRITLQQVEGGPLNREEILRLAVSILLGGLETTASVLGFIANYLAGDPKGRRELIVKRSLIPAAVEELLRRFSPLTYGRIVTEDCVFHNVSLKKDDHVACALGMFNMDETKFSDALSVNLERARNQHLTFGIGPHFCVGHFLARHELRVFLEEWLPIISDFRVFPDAQVRYRKGLTLGLINLPLMASA
jgi:cytochrome P450